MEELIKQLTKEIAVHNKLTALILLSQKPYLFSNLNLYPHYKDKKAELALKELLDYLYSESEDVNKD